GLAVPPVPEPLHLVLSGFDHLQRQPGRWESGLVLPRERWFPRGARRVPHLLLEVVDLAEARRVLVLSDPDPWVQQQPAERGAEEPGRELHLRDQVEVVPGGLLPRRRFPDARPVLLRRQVDPLSRCGDRPGLVPPGG